MISINRTLDKTVDKIAQTLIPPNIEVEAKGCFNNLKTLPKPVNGANVEIRVNQRPKGCQTSPYLQKKYRFRVQVSLYENNKRVVRLHYPVFNELVSNKVPLFVFDNLDVYHIPLDGVTVQPVFIKSNVFAEIALKDSWKITTTPTFHVPYYTSKYRNGKIVSKTSVQFEKGRPIKVMMIKAHGLDWTVGSFSGLMSKTGLKYQELYKKWRTSLENKCPVAVVPNQWYICADPIYMNIIDNTIQKVWDGKYDGRYDGRYDEQDYKKFHKVILWKKRHSNDNAKPPAKWTQEEKDFLKSL